jgi:hypothetical protein
MRIRKRLLFPALGVVALLAFAQANGVDPRLYLEDVKFLASREMRGRASGSPELERAADFLGARFHSLGLQPLNGKSYFQTFEITTSAALGGSNQLRFENGRVTSAQFPRDFIPLNISAAGRLAGALVFVGYGITAPEYGYDDYAGIDVKGKVALMLRHEPQENDAGSIFAGASFTQHATFASKASNAKMHGAAAIILVNDLPAHRGEPDDLERFGSTDGPFDSGIPFVQVKEKVVDQLFPPGSKLETIEASIDHDLTPRSFAFADSVKVSGVVDVERVRKPVRNAGAYLPGRTNEYVIVGAHYDHLGLGGPASLAPSLTGQVHPGADDNASGAAGVLALAKWFASRPQGRRGILFLEFAGEEIGLLGSAYYASHPAMPLENAALMVNMDMIGRLRDNNVYIGGVDTAPELRGPVENAGRRFGFNLDLSDNAGFGGSSDHISFTARQVPALFFFTGLHPDYHKPSDTWDKITAPQTARLLDMIADLITGFRDDAAMPRFTRVTQSGHEGVSEAVGGTSGTGAYFGSVPDFGEEVNGAKFSDVREGSPAAKAGLKPGDILVEFAGKPIGNLYDFTYALRAGKPGDSVKVKVLRGGSALEATVELTARQ